MWTFRRAIAVTTVTIITGIEIEVFTTGTASGVRCFPIRCRSRRLGGFIFIHPGMQRFARFICVIICVQPNYRELFG